MPVIGNIVTNSNGDTSSIYIEVDEPRAVSAIDPLVNERETNPFADTRADAPQIVSDAFNKGLELIRTCAEQIVATVKKVEQMAQPAEFEVQLAIKLDSQVGAILAKTGAEAQLQVTLKWVKGEVAQNETKASV